MSARQPLQRLVQLTTKSESVPVTRHGWYNRLIAIGRLVRLSPGVYAKTVVDAHGGFELSAPPQVLAREVLAKTGQTATIERRRKPRSETFEVPEDVTQLPHRGVGTFVARLAKAHGVAYKRTQLDDFAEAVTRLAGDDEQLDDTGKLLATLRKKSVINGPQLARLMTNHMSEQQDAVRSVR